MEPEDPQQPARGQEVAGAGTADQLQSQKQVLIPRRRDKGEKRQTGTGTGHGIDAPGMLDALQLIATLREQVLVDIVDRDKARLVDAVQARIAAQTDGQDRDVIKSCVSAEFADRMKIFGSLAGVVTLALGFVGYTSMRDSLTVTARATAEAEAEREANQAFERHRKSLDDMREELSAMLLRGEERLSDASSSAQSSAGQAMIAVTKHVTDASATFKSDLDAVRVDNLHAIETAAGEAKKSVEGEKTSALAAILSARPAELQQFNVEAKRIRDGLEGLVAEEVRRQLAQKSISVAADSSATSGPKVTGEAAPTSLDVLMAQLAADRSYDFRTIDGIASQIDPEKNAQVLRFAFNSVFDSPTNYTPDERRSAANRVLDPRIPASDSHGAALEVMIVALRCMDHELFVLGSEARAANLYTRIAPPDDLTDLVRVTMAKPDSDESRRAFSVVNQDNLTVRGLVNLLAIGKRAGVGAKLAGLEQRVISELFVVRGDNTAPYLDRWSDYSAAVFVVDVLTTQPVINRKEVAGTLDKILSLVLPADSDSDPFDLRGRIQRFLKE